VITYDELESRISVWAATELSVRAVLVCGSRARGTADAFSDLDVLILSADPPGLITNSVWMDTFGTSLLVYADTTGPGDHEWYALYEGGIKLDAVILAVNDPAETLDILLLSYPYQGVISRGIKVLFDRYGSARAIPPRPIDISPAPDSDAFRNLIGGFLVDSLTTAKFIARGDMLRAQHWFAHDLRPRLLKLIEWHAHGRDTWYDGRFIEEWADPRALSALPAFFPRLDRTELTQSLLFMIDFTRRFGTEVAARLGTSVPESHGQITELVRSILSDTAGSRSEA